MLVCTIELRRHPNKLDCSPWDGSEVYNIRPVRELRSKHVQHR